MHCKYCQTFLFDKKIYKRERGKGKTYVQCPNCKRIFKIKRPMELWNLLLFACIAAAGYVFFVERELLPVLKSRFVEIPGAVWLVFSLATPLLAGYEFPRLDLIDVDDPDKIHGKKLMSLKKASSSSKKKEKI